MSNKRERVLQHLQSDSPAGYTPAAFFLHFGSEFQRGEAAVRRHQEFFRATDMDFVKIQFEVGFPKQTVESPSDYDSIPDLPLSLFENQLAVVKGLVDSLKEEALAVVTLYSPFMIVNGMVGPKRVAADLEATPEPVVKAIDRVSEGLLGFVRECVRIGVDGFYHSTQGGESHRFQDRQTFLDYVKPNDLRVMGEIDQTCSFNILHICDYHQEFGGYDDLDLFVDYPGTVVNISTDIGGEQVPTACLAKVFNRPYMGGLMRGGPIATGSPAEARQAAQEVLKDRPARFILGADCTVGANTPWENLRAAIDEAHGA